MTPLFNWNPYNLEYKGDPWTPLGRSVTDGNRDGSNSRSLAFNGINRAFYFQTPAEFFGPEVGADAADTRTHTHYVLDRRGNIRAVKASGVRIFLSIADVGRVRMRYPIAPLHIQGDGTWKELEALKDLVLEPRKYAHMYRESINFQEGPAFRQAIPPLTLELTIGPHAQHNHVVELSGSEVIDLMQGKTIYTTSEENEGHTHNIKIVYLSAARKYKMEKCDGRRVCEHPKQLKLVQ